MLIKFGNVQWMQEKHESWDHRVKAIASIVWSCSPKWLFCGMRRFIDCASTYIDNLMTQFNKGKGYEGIRKIKIFEFGNSRSDISCCDH